MVKDESMVLTKKALSTLLVLDMHLGLETEKASANVSEPQMAEN